jgi:hypothetical protein
MMTCRTPTPSQPVEALVDFRKLQAMGQELVDRQASRAESAIMRGTSRCSADEPT